MDRIAVRLKEAGGFTPEISKALGWGTGLGGLEGFFFRCCDLYGQTMIALLGRICPLQKDADSERKAVVYNTPEEFDATVQTGLALVDLMQLENLEALIAINRTDLAPLRRGFFSRVPDQEGLWYLFIKM